MRTRSVVAPLLGVLAAVGLFTGRASPQTPPASSSAAGTTPPSPTGLAIPFEKTTLKNGMVVILSEDHTVPLVAVNVMVKVGSRFEREGRTGFAHLFEHLMFMGTDRVPTGDLDGLMEAQGGWNNAQTSEDRTDYFDVGPSHSLPLLLWLEADRLASLGSAMTPEKLEAQRKVVRNERRQTSENKPYGEVELRLPELLYPVGHPYHHPVIGSHEDLEAAQVADVKAFFDTYYAANNLSLVVAGDFDSKAIKPQIERLFGGLKSSSALPQPAASPPKLTSVVREKLVDANIQLPKIVMAWHSPARFAAGDADLDILANVLDRGKTSRLYKALVFDKELAQSVNASQNQQDLSSIFEIEAIARPGVTLDALEKEIDKVLSNVIDKGVTDAEVERAKNDYETSFVLGLESVPDRAATLNNYETFANDPGFIDKDLARYRKVTSKSVNAIAKSTLDLGGRVILRIEPKVDAQPEKPPVKKHESKSAKTPAPKPEKKTEKKTEKKGGSK